MVRWGGLATLKTKPLVFALVSGARTREAAKVGRRNPAPHGPLEFMPRPVPKKRQKKDERPLLVISSIVLGDGRVKGHPQHFNIVLDRTESGEVG